MTTPQSRILYIEDHEDTRDLVSLVLTASNYQVTTTGSIGEGLRLSREKHFDLYIIDSWLPDGSGVELCKQLRQLDDKTPIMFLSAAAYEADKQAAMTVGAQSYLVKPADIQTLSKEVNALILASANKHDKTDELARTHSTLRGSMDEPTAQEVIQV